MSLYMKRKTTKEKRKTQKKKNCQSFNTVIIMIIFILKSSIKDLKNTKKKIL